MTLRKSPRGLISPYTREGVTTSLKKTAKHSAIMRKAAKLLEVTARSEPLTEEEAEDVIGDIELLAMEIRAAARSSIKELEQALKTTRKYLAENTE